MALREVADLSGYHFGNGDEYQYKFIGSIVERVSGVIKRTPLLVPDYLVGLPSQVLEVKKLLDVGSDDVVHMIGIHGMGGLGKTTLSLVVYNSIAAYFDESCFLQNVRKNSNKNRLHHLQSIFLSKMLCEKNIILTSWQEGASMIQQRLGRKKVLLILDDVDDREQLQAVSVGMWRPRYEPNNLLSSSLYCLHYLVFPSSPNHDVAYCMSIIIRVDPSGRRVAHMLPVGCRASTGRQCHMVVEALNFNDSLQLLIWNAFKRENVDPSYEDVLKRVVTYASGLPLALKVIGSNLYSKSVEEWESAIEHYKIIPNGEILEILKIEKILGALYDKNMKHHIGVLVDKSLIGFWTDREDYIDMHDLIEDMGRHIEWQKSPEEPGKRRRLWLEKDILHVLKHDKELYYEGRKIMFQFPGARFPEWFDLKSSGPSCSFWFRNKFPARVLSLLIIHMNKNDEFLTFYPQVYINGKYQTLGGKSGNEQTKFEFDLTYLSDLKMYGNFHEQPSEKEWNHVKVTYYAQNVKATGIHVFEENKEDIRFDDPYIMEDIMEEEQKEEEKEEVEEEEEEKKEKAEEEENSIMEDTMEEEGRRGKRRKLH
ncbi:hypothetical protein LR48_Vigan10g047500 [Vigna angularis]|uniref:NB-ARC domain-containing protein n=1 Tax=Phaseolus angularis TaxID=3914 RepID=A0A0L9VHY1_PHAAN|nr:hypothetical protein LR48_Vigan10g047500 [Vigna angularis]